MRKYLVIYEDAVLGIYEPEITVLYVCHNHCGGMYDIRRPNLPPLTIFDAQKSFFYSYLESYRACPIPRPRGKRGVVLLVQAGALPRYAACAPDMKKYFFRENSTFQTKKIFQKKVLVPVIIRKLRDIFNFRYIYLLKTVCGEPRDFNKIQINIINNHYCRFSPQKKGECPQKLKFFAKNYSNSALY
jgi:hypothetical protein